MNFAARGVFPSAAAASPFIWKERRITRRTSLRLITLLLVFTSSRWAGQPRAEEEKSLAEIAKLSGKIVRDEKVLNKPVVGIDLEDTKVTDAGLECLMGLSNLDWLNLSGTAVTDGGLKHLEGLSKLTSLDLEGISVTDAGIEHLKGLDNLQSLSRGAPG